MATFGSRIKTIPLWLRPAPRAPPHRPEPPPIELLPPGSYRPNFRFQRADRL
jgi:hypothetical protein